MLPSTRSLEIFCAVMEAGSFAQAAARLGLTPAAVSRAVARHEAELGVRLLHRTTRAMRPTDAGRSYFERCRVALGQLEEAATAVTRGRAEPRGLVRMSLPTTYGHHRVLPALPLFLERNPEVSIEVDLSNRNVDLITEGIDLAVRMGPLADSTLVVRKLEDAPIGVFASPAYLERHGIPSAPEALDRHLCIAFVRPSTGRPLPWVFREPDGTPLELSPGDRIRCAGDALGGVTLARAGVGLLQAYRFVVEDDLRRGSLVEVLTAHSGRTGPFSLLQASREGRTLAVERLAGFLIGHLGSRA